ncbi:tetratricopeptide repeat protein [Flammeovirga pacifica]|uniref:MalT-like TPR region domain-containing protein n=1 Tax=Flammeovirga pacifica TaxID=915059 RepID=A0A1S1Z244_FLAPC|nr:tetratricopeptide repeat protein [Flammeovirga pacifica]OHX67340.1 hypothetical protein NH26_13790 [Flammeovirga pacifica]
MVGRKQVYKRLCEGIGILIFVLLPHLLFAQNFEIDSLLVEQEEISEIQYELDSLLSNNFHVEAQHLSDSIITLAKEKYLNTDERIVLLHKRLAEKFADKGYSNIASQYLQKGLAILRAQPTPNYAFIGDMYMYLAHIFRHHQLSNIAINYFEQATDAYEQAKGMNHYYNLINAYMTLGNYHFEIQNFGSSTSYYTKASDIIAEMDTEYREDMFIILNRIATAHSSTGSYRLALQNLSRSKEIAKKVFGKTALEIQRVNEQIANVYFKKGDYDSANIYALESLDILNRNIGTQDQRQSYMRQNTEVFFNKRKYNYAHVWYRKLFDDLLNTNKELNDVNDIISWYTRIGGKFERVSQDSIALLIYNECLVVNQKSFGEDNLKAAELMHKISRTLAKVRKYEEAEAMTNNAYALEWKMGASKDSTQLVVQQIDLAGLLLQKGDTIQSVELYEKVIETEKNNESRWKAMAYNNLSMIHFSNQSYDSSFYYASRLLEYYNKNYGRDYVKTMGCYLLLGNIVFGMGKEHDAVENYYSKPIRLSPKLFIKHNEVALQANLNLSNYYLKENKEDLSHRYDNYAREIQVYISSGKQYP